jgi:hypothetical protein
MEVIIVLILIGIVCFFIYQSSPNAKYKKAQNLFAAKHYIQSINILNLIFDKHINAPAKLAECKFKLGQQALDKTEKIKYFNEVTELGKRISNTQSLVKFQNIEAKALFEIAKIRYEETKGNIEKLNQNIRFIDTANQKGSESIFSSLKIKHFSDLADSLSKNANEKEKSGRHSDVIDAIQSYTTAKKYAKKSDNHSVFNNSAARITICQLKLRQQINLDSFPEIQKADKNYQKELYYRYAIHLIKNKDFLEAENIILSHLNFQSSDIDKLNEFLVSEKTNNIVKAVAEINNAIGKLYKNALSLVELKSLYESLEDVSNLVSSLDKQLAKRISTIKPTIFNRLLIYYLEAAQYGNAISIIQNYPRFWESPELLKNLGICCFGIISNGLLSESNYHIVISGWLTSVFSDMVILKSLDDTTWDDDYKFSLFESIGSNHSKHKKLPENVNYDEVSETNISIGAIQRELLQQFENIIHKKIHDDNLSKLVNDFYDSEKEAIEKVVEVVENDIFFATPYFAILHGLNNEIIKELDKDYHNYSNEYALEAGIPYIKNSESAVVYKYFYAIDLIDKLKSAICREDLVMIKRMNTKDNIDLIEEFENIRRTVEDKLFNSISNKTSEDNANEKLIPIMEECIAFSSQNEKLKYHFSNYVNNYCISRVNDEKIDIVQAMSLMKGAYSYSPNNPRIVKNFITLIRLNLLNILLDQTRTTTEIYSTLDWVLNNMSQVYRQHSIELSKERENILRKLVKEGVNIALLDDGWTYPNLNIRRQSLTPQGLKTKKVLTYLKDLGKENYIDSPFINLSNWQQQFNLDDNN